MYKIAIDGPAGSGKSTMANQISRRLGFTHVDTGAMYRVIGLACLQKGIDTQDEAKVEGLCGSLDIDIRYEDGEQKMYLYGKDVSRDIRKEEAGRAASDVSRLAAVREKLFSLQRGLAEKYNVVMDGRDIGTVILPDANLKIFLTATAECRAMRRYLQLKQNGQEADLESIKQDILKRDYNDSHRALSPLKKADDAFEIDSTDMTIEEVTERITELWEKTEKI